jgi:streptomycin 6-kinase
VPSPVRQRQCRSTERADERALVKNELSDRILFCARAWRVTIQRTVATGGAMVVAGQRAGQPVVLKVVKQPGEEWQAGEIAALFGGRGVVQVLEHTEGAALYERLYPGDPLAALVLDGRDEQATDILAMILGRMSPREPPEWCPTVEKWGEGFTRYVTSGDTRIEPALVASAQRIFAELCATQREPGLLHGDLHHYNVLSDRARGWCAIDPRGVVGELEYELGAALRNPYDRPELFAALEIAERRLEQFGLALGIDVGRARGWAFAQAVLAAIWHLEHGRAFEIAESSLSLARALLASEALRDDFL